MNLCGAIVYKSVPRVIHYVNIPLIIFLLERLHVLSDVATEDILLENLSIKLLAFGVIARETLLIVGDVEATVGSTLEGTEHTRTRRRALETDVKVTLEWSGSIFIVERLGQLDGAIGLRNTLILVGKAELGESTAGNKETSSIGYRVVWYDVYSGDDMLLTGSPVCQTVVDTISGKLLGAGGGEDKVALNTSVDDLGNDLLVGEADNKTVLGGVAVPKFKTWA